MAPMAPTIVRCPADDPGGVWAEHEDAVLWSASEVLASAGSRDSPMCERPGIVAGCLSSSRPLSDS